jgi:hypothetical protein
MIEIQFKQLGGQKWRLLGDDGNEFASPEEAWPEAQFAANLGLPWAGATFRLVDIDAADHGDDCVRGLGPYTCDCSAEPVVLEERVLFPPEGVIQKLAFGGLYGRYKAHRAVTDERRLAELGRGTGKWAGLGALVVEGVLEPKDEGEA